MPRRKTPDRDGVYQRKDRPGQFWASWTDQNGKRRQRRLRGVFTLTQAKELLAAAQLRVERIKVLGFAEPTKERFEKIEARFLLHQRARLTKAGYERERGVVETHLHDYFGQMQLALIRRGDIANFVTKRAAEVSPATVAKELVTLKHLFRLCVEWELLVLNPATGVKAPKVAPGRVRWLQPEELRALLQACPDWLRPIAGLAAATGMRRSEVLGVRWFDVDRRNGCLTLRQTKNNESRIVFLNQSALHVIDSLRKGKSSEKLFPKVTPEQVSMGFLRTCRELGIEDFRWHDLRHCFASLLRQSGADLQDVAELLGHKDLRMTKRYSHLSPAHLSAAARRFDAVLGEPLSLADPSGGRGA
ncbi:phage integrase [Candidatus Koribacter versatilis Ellin345]|uniref:Phage integrase n=1 Tax=Koribacter versatilis (strain Ellin345) TaxID=204669 RepID=Q1IPY0_KORVE|nr:site-specific integrase [Candidatus Koribacter versatilis]ABF41070.1 phage integrase [Candidatus Koribacter versatilis Ellin345]